MKKIRILISLICSMALCMMPLQAKEASGTMSLVFEGNSEEFIKYQEESAFEHMAPGEERTQMVQLSNQDYREMKFFVRSEYSEPLGEGLTSEQIAYEIEFLHNGEVFYSGKIGGINKAHIDSFNKDYLLKTLKKGETSNIEIRMKIDGVSMDNSYQNQIGNLKLIFSVEYDEPPVSGQINDIIEQFITGSTGHQAQVSAALGMVSAGIIAMVVVLIMRKKDREEEEHER